MSHNWTDDERKLPTDRMPMPGPDHFDRLMGSLHGLTDEVHSAAVTIPHMPPFGIGAETYIVQTYRVKELGDTIFLQWIVGNSAVRIAIPARVADTIARQRDQLSTKTRKKAGRARAAADKAAGILPGFMRAKGKAGKK